jgi:hypothetical protein
MKNSTSKYFTLLSITNKGTTHTVYHFDSINEFDDNIEAMLSFIPLYTPSIDRWIRIKAIYQVEVEYVTIVCLAAGLTVALAMDPNSAIQHELESSDLSTHSCEHIYEVLTTKQFTLV